MAVTDFLHRQHRVESVNTPLSLESSLFCFQKCPHVLCLDEMVGQTQRQLDQGHRRVAAATGREHAAARNVEVAHAEHPAIGIDRAPLSRLRHARCPHVMRMRRYRDVL